MRLTGSYWLLREVEVALEGDVGFSDLLGLAQVGYRVADGVVVFQAQQGSEFVQAEFIDTHVA